MNSLPLKFYSEHLEHQPLKVSVFRRIQELQAINHQLFPITQLTKKEKRLWLEEHGETLQSSLEYFSGDIHLGMSRSEMDPATIDLLVEYATALQEFTTVIESLLAYRKQLRS